MIVMIRVLKVTKINVKIKKLVKKRDKYNIEKECYYVRAFKVRQHKA